MSAPADVAVPTVVELAAGPLRVALRPDLGGSIAGCWHDGVPVLRSSEPLALAGARAAGCFPLVPYSNRIALRRFRWQGHDYTTAPNFDDSPHSLHGNAWLRAWQLVDADAASARLRLDSVPDADWPFAYRVEQRIAASAGRLVLELEFTNTDARAQPVGLGWHPYFPKRQRSRLHIEIAERWESDASGLPTRRVAQPGIDGDVAHLGFDHCFEGWRGAARLRDEQFALALESSLRYLVVYTPATRPYYCVEPVSHLSNAIHMAEPAVHGLVRVDPGATLSAQMQLSIEAVR